MASSIKSGRRLQERRSSFKKLLSDIQKERENQKTNSSTFQEGYIVLKDVAEFWTGVFRRLFLLPKEEDDDDLGDDLLFFVKKKFNYIGGGAESETSSVITSLEVFRKDSPNIPGVTEPCVDWEETVYLNLILQHFQYLLTCAVCRTNEKGELVIMKRSSSHPVYATPNKRHMDKKGKDSELSYPDIFFMIDDFEEIFGDIVVQEGQCLVVELLAKDANSNFEGVIFLGSVTYDSLWRVYDEKADVAVRFARKMSLGLYRENTSRVEFIRMRGPHDKGFTEVAVKSAGQWTGFQPGRVASHGTLPSEGTGRSRQEGPNCDSATTTENGEEKGVKKVRRNGRVDDGGAWGPEEEAMGFEFWDAEFVSQMSRSLSLPDNCTNTNGDDSINQTSNKTNLMTRSLNWFKVKRSQACMPLKTSLTFVTLPWNYIIADVLEVNKLSILTCTLTDLTTG